MRRRERQAAESLRHVGGAVTALPLDVGDETSVLDLAAWVRRDFGRVDVLVNNAAVLLHEGDDTLTIPVAAYRDSLETNFLGPLRLCQDPLRS